MIDQFLTCLRMIVSQPVQRRMVINWSEVQKENSSLNKKNDTDGTILVIVPEIIL